MLAMPAAWNRISRARGRGRFSHSRGVWMMVSADIPSSAAIRANHIICVTSLSLFTVRRHCPRRPAGPSGGRFRVIAQLVLIHLAVDAVHEVGNGLGVQVGDGVAHGGGETVGFVVRPVDLLKILLCPRDKALDKLLVRGVQYGDEFITGEPCHHTIFAKGIFEQTGGKDQRGVALSMPVGIVDRLEAVQVDHNAADPCVLPLIRPLLHSNIRNGRRTRMHSGHTR